MPELASSHIETGFYITILIKSYAYNIVLYRLYCKQFRLYYYNINNNMHVVVGRTTRYMFTINHLRSRRVLITVLHIVYFTTPRRMLGTR